jgi:dimethylhistidine N-methyltransferase
MSVTEKRPRLQLLDAESPEEQLRSFAEEIRDGLTQTPKKTSPRFLYDERGSELFTGITQTNDYYVTDVERSILNAYAKKIFDAVGSRVVLNEPGAGDCAKTRILIEAALECQDGLHFEPIDISGAQIKKTSQTLINQYEDLKVTGVTGRYEKGLERLDPVEDPRLIVFLGSSIGNFSRDEAVDLLAKFDDFMEDRDRLLIGVDLIKDREVLERAYNDSEGVTAEFNKNLLRRINRELGGRFDPDTFTHRAPFLEEKSRVEMRLETDREQDVYVENLSQSFHFDEGEYIHTESSHKFTVEGFKDLAAEAGLIPETHWTDDREYVAEILFRTGN